MTLAEKMIKRRREHGTEGRKYGAWGKDFLRDENNHRAAPTDQHYDTLLFKSNTTFVSIDDLELPEGDQDAFEGVTFLSGSILHGYFVGLEIDNGNSSAVVCYRSKE